MKIIIAGGTGLIGTCLVKHWLSKNHDIIVIGRSQEKIEKTFQNRVEAIEWRSLKSNDFKDAEVVINLAGASIAGKRWSDAIKREIIDSRLNTTRKIVNMLLSLKHKAPSLFNASAIGTYGLQQEVNDGLPPKLDENEPTDWNNAPDFLAYVAREWEKATFPAKEKQIRVVNMRFGVVLAKQGGALQKIIKPFYFFLGGPIGSGQQPFSWIAIDDVVRAIDFILENKQISGPVSIVSPGCVTQRELSAAVSKVIRKPNLIPTPAFLLKLIFGQMANELLLKGQHVYPKKLLNANFKFFFSDIKSALEHIMEN